MVSIHHSGKVTLAEAWQLAAWEDDDPDRTRKRDLLQDIVTALVLTPVRWGKGRGYLAGFRGDVGIDTTAVPVFARPPRTRRSTGELIASTEITAGWHHSAGNAPPEYGYSATLPVAARTRPALGSFPQPSPSSTAPTPTSNPATSPNPHANSATDSHSITKSTSGECRAAPTAPCSSTAPWPAP
ncbi:hypothetical protein [Nonomuraea sp. NPDC046570]|uniref:hypothetical protein n=1 Tax=Nonomuraea sp. NPDC046570 TaxID=3155255 RepID=UPI003411001F